MDPPEGCVLGLDLASRRWEDCGLAVLRWRGPRWSGWRTGFKRPSGVPSAPRLVELIRAHRSTMIFVNSRRLAERLATAINEVADEEIALAHHGSIARDTRLGIEDRLKRGKLPAIVATSSLELGIDMGAVDLVIQVEAPPSIASGIQRIGRAGHQVGALSSGRIFPRYTFFTPSMIESNAPASNGARFFLRKMPMAAAPTSRNPTRPS